jgi:hypothetical protein
MRLFIIFFFSLVPLYSFSQDTFEPILHITVEKEDGKNLSKLDSATVTIHSMTYAWEVRHLSDTAGVVKPFQLKKGQYLLTCTKAGFDTAKMTIDFRRRTKHFLKIIQSSGTLMYDWDTYSDYEIFINLKKKHGVRLIMKNSEEK